MQAPLRLQVRIGFKIDNPKNEGAELSTIEESQRRTERLEKYMPKLQDAFVVDLISYVPRLYRRNSKLDMQEIANRLREVGQRTIGKSRILSVEIKIAEGETQAEAQAPPNNRETSAEVTFKLTSMVNYSNPRNQQRDSHRLTGRCGRLSALPDLGY